MVRACVVALDDRFYFPGEYKRQDFSCNTQFGSYCAAALGSALGGVDEAVLFIDAGAQGEAPSRVLDRLAQHRPDVLVLIPCGRYRDATYAIIQQAVDASECRVSIVAGACLPDEPTTLLDRVAVVDGVLLGDDFSRLGAVVRLLERKRGWRAEIHRLPGFAWRTPDGMVSIVRGTGTPGGLSAIPRSQRETGLRVAVDRDARQPDRFGKWLLDSSIGCPRHCIYCRTPVISRRQGDSSWRPRPASDLADEMETIVRTYGVHEFRFQDDNFLMPSAAAWSRCHELAEEILRRRLRVHFQIMFHASVITESDEAQLSAAFEALESVGLERVFLGIESGHGPTLEYYRKESTTEMNECAIGWLVARDLVVVCGSVVFHPRTTLEQLTVEHKFFGRWIVHPRVAALAPLGSYAHLIPGTALEQEIIDRGLGTRDEAEFRPADEAAARALRAMLRFRRHLFAHDWFLFTIKRDLVHWERALHGSPEVTLGLAPAMAQVARLGVDLSAQIIQTAAAGAPTRPLVDTAAAALHRAARDLEERVRASPFAPHWRAGIYAAPAPA